MLTLLLSLSRLSGMSQLETDSAELLTRVGKQWERWLKAANPLAAQLLLYHHPSPCPCWQLLVEAHFSLQNTQRYLTDVQRSDVNPKADSLALF